MFRRANIEKLKLSGQIDNLVQMLKDRRPRIREEALTALFDIKIETTDYYNQIRFILNDRNSAVKTKASLLFARKGDLSVLDNLRDIIAYGSINDQVEVLRILPHYYKKDNPKITEILALALKDKKLSVQSEAIRTIGEMAIETMAVYLLDFIHHNVSKVRYDIIIALGRIKNPVAVDSLIGALTDSSPEVRNAAEFALKNIDTERATNALKHAPFMLLVKQMNESVSRRLSTVINIGKQKKEFGLLLLHKACFDEYKSIRIEAIKSIGMLKNESSMNLLIDLLADKYYDVRIEALRSLSRFNTQIALDSIKILMSDKNTNVRNEAKKAYIELSSRLEQINKKKH